MLARREGESRQGSSVFFTKTKFSEDVKSGGGILLGDLKVQNKELRPERKDDADFFAILSPRDFLYVHSILKGTFSESKLVKDQNQVFLRIHPFYRRVLDRGDLTCQGRSFKSLLFD
jgi:hypothetical protein